MNLINTVLKTEQGHMIENPTKNYINIMDCFK